MSKMLSQIMAEGNTIQYEYDFGSTTELEVKCIGRFTTIMQGKKTIQVLSRNTEPLFPCDECGKHPAVQICTSCQWDGEGWLCKKCAEKHDCGDELYFLPVVNSPRAGVCDYSGE